MSEPVTGNRHDMAKLKGSECETILKAAGGVFGDKGFIGTDYITTPIRKPEGRELYIREHDYNNQISSFRAPVERAVATLKTWRILFTRLQKATRDVPVLIPGCHRLVLLQGDFRISLRIPEIRRRAPRTIWLTAPASGTCPPRYAPGLNRWPRRAHGIISSGSQSRQTVIVIYHDNRKSTGIGNAS